MNTALKITGVVTGTLLATVLYFNVRRKGRDKLATEFIGILQKHLKIGGGTLEAESAFSERYLDIISKDIPRSARVIQLKPSVAKRVAQIIKNAWGWNDDEEAVYGAFRGLKDKVQVSQVALAYKAIDGVSLLDKLRDRLNTKERKIVLDIVSALPKYRTL